MMRLSGVKSLCPLARGRMSGAIACMMRRLSCFAFGIAEKRVPDSQYGSALRRRFNVPAGHASTFRARQLRPLEVREGEVEGDSQSGGRTPRVRIPLQPLCLNPEGRQDQGPAVARVSRAVSPIIGQATLRLQGDGAHD